MAVSEPRFDQLRNLPVFTDIRQKVGEVGISAVVRDALIDANVHIGVEGDMPALREIGQSVLAIGDHSQGLESLLIIGGCGYLGRDDIAVTAKPYALTGQVVTALSGEEHMIGFIPSAMASDRSGGDMGMRIHRALFRSRLVSTEATKDYNQSSMNRAASALGAGRFVTMFPTGGVYPAATTPWKNGIGHLVKQLSEVELQQTLAAPFKFEGISAKAIMASVSARFIGIRPLKRRDLVLRFANQSVLSEVFPDGTNHLSAAEITSVLQQQYNEHFDSAALN